MKRYRRNPEFAEYLAKHGYTVQITEGEGTENERVIREYYVSPEEIAERNNMRGQNA
jgi:hypothetical protein